MGTLARAVIRSKACEIACGWMGLPSGSANTHGGLLPATATHSACCHAFQPRRTATVVGSRSMRRREFRVLLSARFSGWSVVSGRGRRGRRCATRARCGRRRRVRRDDEMDLKDRLGCEGLPSVGREQHVVVERLEMVGSEPAQNDAPEGGKNVMFDLSAVAVPGAGTEREPLGWQPSFHEVSAESERPTGVVATVDVGRQSFSQALSVGAPGTRRVPAALLDQLRRSRPVTGSSPS